MRSNVRIGTPFDPETPDSPIVGEVLIDKHDDHDRDVLIVRTTHGQWLARHDNTDETIEADSAQELAELLWDGGRCPYFIAEALFRIGWLTLDVVNLKLADVVGWRQADPLRTSRLPRQQVPTMAGPRPTVGV